MNEIARSSRTDRAELFVETAARKSISSAVAMEKDFWVCWTLKQCFEPSPLSNIVFKGGTSLSKVYRAITRFSEDIDLTIPREMLGFSGPTDLDIGSSKTKQKHLLSDMSTACKAHVANEMLPALKRRFAGALDGGHTFQDWDLGIDSDDHSTLVFTYSPALTGATYGAGAYIRPAVRLEFGGRSDVWPEETRDVQPYCTEVFPDIATNPTCRVHVLAAERTFWEKATILHVEYHRPITSSAGERVSRHYSDAARLDEGEIGERALAKLDLLYAVVQHKEHFYPSRWARYGEAAAGAIRLAPHADLERALRRDYAQMRDMFFEEPEPFDAIIKQLTDLEAKVNAATR